MAKNKPLIIKILVPTLIVAIMVGMAITEQISLFH